MTLDEIDNIMDRAIAALREAAPDLPIMAVIAFPTDRDGETCIYSGGNMEPDVQRRLLTVALDGLSNKHSTSGTAH